MARIELDARFIVGIVEVERSLARDEQERRVIDSPFDAVVENFHRFFPFIELVLEEFLIFFRFDVRFVACPQGLHGIQRPRFRVFFFRCVFDDLAIGILRFFLGREIHGNRVTDIVGILLDQALEGHLVGVVFFTVIAVEVLAQAEDDRRAVFRFLTFFQAVFTIACGFPFISLFFAGLAGDDGDFIGDHEGRIEADAELADEVLVRAVCILGFLQFFQESLGAGLGDGAQVFHQILFVHAQAVIGDSQRVGIGVRRQMDFKGRVPFEKVAVGQRLVMQLVDSIGCVGNQFAQEDFVIRINRMDHQVQ